MYVTSSNEFYHPSTIMSSPIQSKKNCINRFEQKITAGQSLFREGDDADYVYEVLTGVLRLTRVLENGRRQVIAFGYPGDIVGFPRDGLYRTECDVIADGTVIAHNKKALENADFDPSLHQFLLKAALDEIAFMQDHFLMLGLKSATEKTASFLLVLMARNGERLDANTVIHLPMSRSDIADFLGLTTETVSRTISQLRASGIIKLEDAQSLIVLDPDGLRYVADNE